ncbi:ABC transporter permease [Flavitalea sp. BT771]|uniref:ABC transporter permease n=1 Tax=Flavitalea sp. BT771 TaxID=3063329 RepID=UPI0026E3EEC8|nr:FtsX-like permease family protein [Flavitalea sp. BT771]MDO6431947.1 ABC transporter permease [Flavitalea sp. BT771]MDV6220856.1 FtsX-like permease family protein [Flavitalea sp. BT771]
MLTHLFKLIWNKKKQNFLLMTEMFVSFIILFAVFTALVYYYQNYHRPMGFEYDRVWKFGYNAPREISDPDSMAAFRGSVRQLIRSMPQIEEVSFSSENIPFGNDNNVGGVNYYKKNVGADKYTVDDSYSAVLHVSVKEGRWFSKEDDAAKEKPVVINETLKKSLFGNENAIGKLIGEGGEGMGNMKIVGVINDLKDKGDFAGPHNGLYRRVDTGNYGGGAILLKVSSDADRAFESRLFKVLSSTMRNPDINIQHLAYMRTRINNIRLIPVIITLIVAGFLIINVALGLFGVLWYNISKRKSEIGLRRAVGASGHSISGQLVGEALVLSTISLIVGSFFALQFPLLNIFDLPALTYLIAQGLAIAFIYLLVMICAFYPGRQAAAIYPAVALHED